MSKLKKYDEMDEEQKQLYLQLTDIVHNWAKSKQADSAAGLARIHEVLVSFTMAIAAFCIMKRSKGDVRHENGAQNRASDTGIHTESSSESRVDPK